MRSDLAAIPGVTNIETNTDNQVCTFELADEALDIEAKLAELSETNEHIAGWSMM